MHAIRPIATDLLVYLEKQSSDSTIFKQNMINILGIDLSI